MLPHNFIGKKFGTCRLIDPIHRGGVSFSFMSFDDRLLEHRVTKISRTPFIQNGEDDIEASVFKKEGRILSKLDHPQIGRIVEWGNEHGYWYITTEYIEGIDLSKIIWILNNKKKELNCAWHELLDPLTALCIVGSGLVPLSYLHSARIELGSGEVVNGLAHRDLTPSNLLLGFKSRSAESKVYIVDFGIAKLNAEISATFDAAVMGHVKYMSPMRFFSKSKKGPISKYWQDFSQTQHDIHSLGCVLYELLLGEPVINVPDNNVAAAAQAVLNPRTFINVREKIRCFDEGIQGIIHRSIVFPQVRKGNVPEQYKNAVEMLADVSALTSRHAQGESRSEILAQFSKEVEFAGIMKKKTRKIDLIKNPESRSSGLLTRACRSSLFSFKRLFSR